MAEEERKDEKREGVMPDEEDRESRRRQETKDRE